MSDKPRQSVSSQFPLYKRKLPASKNKAAFPNTDPPRIDLNNIPHPSFQALTVEEANKSFDDRVAAAIVATLSQKSSESLEHPVNAGFLESLYKGDNTAFIATTKCLAAMAYHDYFPDEPDLVGYVSEVLMHATPGWCGQFGPGVDRTLDLVKDVLPDFLSDDHEEGNYDMAQMHLIQLAYRHYGQLTTDAQDRLVNVLLATGRLRRLNREDIVTSGKAPDDWNTSGYMELPIPVLGDLLGIHPKLKTVSETENHVLMIHTARYLTNQLLYQRDQQPDHDNRRNGGDGAPTCMRLMLGLLRNILRDDFSEYNAKNYQNETRFALQNLYSYAYDHEVRLAAQMVLDYISAHVAVSSNDTRRMVPFRRRNEGKNVTTMPGGVMDISITDYLLGADPMTEVFAMLSGNLRAFEQPHLRKFPGTEYTVRPWTWTISNDGGDSTRVLLSDYRLPYSIHDLFINNLNRRFFQRLHRTEQDDTDVTGRNCDNYEIYAGSASYLITAGGSAAKHAIDPYFLGILAPGQDQQIGVAMTTSFMPTIQPGKNIGDTAEANDLIQFSHFSDSYDAGGFPFVMNYGVAPDFACGFGLHLPQWVIESSQPGFQNRNGFHFVDRGSGPDSPGFYLAIYIDGDYALLEAFDTWLHPGKSFEKFRSDVLLLNSQINLRNPDLRGEQAGVYTTQNGSIINFIIWEDHSHFERPDSKQGAKISSIQYGIFGGADNVIDPHDRDGDAGNVTNKFLNGTILNNVGEGRIDITNPMLNKTLILDMTNEDHPRRIDEDGNVEEAGFHNEVWVRFDWKGEQEGDFFHPFNSLASASAVVADGGVIKVMPGFSTERPLISGSKRFRITAPIGGVAFGFMQ